MVAALNFARENLGKQLLRAKRKIGVITYTNAAADEINRRSEEYSCFAISTIHSFAWTLIQPFQRDIKTWLIEKLEKDIQELITKSGRARDVELPQKQERLLAVRDIFQFTYSPTGANSGRASLNHGEVISICADFLRRPLMQEIFISQYPILFIDESQDTNKNLMDVFLNIQQQHGARFMLGLFGDMMQRIYLDGKEHLEKAIGPEWKTPAKIINYRSPQRIIKLVNTIRSEADNHPQRPREGAPEGIARVFIARADITNKYAFEENVCQTMAKIAEDSSWIAPEKDVKMLTLEHKMAAVRLGFEQLYNALDHSKKLRGRAFEKLTTLDPSPQVRDLAFITEILLPLMQACRGNNSFGIMRILKKYSPLLQPKIFSELPNVEADHNQVKEAKQAAEALFALWANDADPSLKDILASLLRTGLLAVPDKLKQGLASNEGTTLPAEGTFVPQDDAEEGGDNDPDERQKQRNVWAAFDNIPFSQISLFYQYITGESLFDTHQGVKGLEFPRVMVILDDEAAGGNLFSYDKLFGAKGLSPTDKSNIQADKDNALTRTNRLFYVICSRAQQSLAIVIYSTNPAKVRQTLLEKGIFTEDEITLAE